MLVFSGTGESKAPGNKRRVTLSALPLHLTGLVSQYHLFIEGTRDILGGHGTSTATSLTSQQGPFTVCAASLMRSREHWVSAVPAVLLMHSEPTPEDLADLVFVRACNHWSHSHHPSKWNSSALLHMSTAISHTLALGQVGSIKPVQQGPTA